MHVCYFHQPFSNFQLLQQNKGPNWISSFILLYWSIFFLQVKVNLNAMFWSKPCSLALAKDSPLRIEEPEFSGMKQLMLKLLLFYSKQSKSIRGATIVYKRIISQVDKPPIYDGSCSLLSYFVWWNCIPQIFWIFWCCWNLDSHSTKSYP